MKINGKDVDEKVLSSEYQRLSQTQADTPDGMKVPDDEVKRIAESNVINRILLTEEGNRRFPEVSEKDTRRKRKELEKQYGPAAAVTITEEDVADEIRIERLIRETQRTAAVPEEDEAKKRYDADPAAWVVPEEVHCSHIVRHTFGGADPNMSLQQIMDAQRMIKSGAPFDEVGKQFSDKFGQAGDLGTFSRGSMVESFENVVFAMKPGEISDIFKTDFGYHIVHLHEKQPAKERSFEEARADIIRVMHAELKNRAVDKLVADLRDSAVIE